MSSKEKKEKEGDKEKEEEEKKEGEVEEEEEEKKTILGAGGKVERKQKGVEKNNWKRKTN